MLLGCVSMCHAAPAHREAGVVVTGPGFVRVRRYRSVEGSWPSNGAKHVAEPVVV
jgi:hypothetical protein